MVTPVALAASSKLAAPSATTSAAPEATAKFGLDASVAACAAVTLLNVPVTCTVVALAIPVAFAASSKLSAPSATSNFAPEARAKFGFPAKVVACAAVTVLDVPVTCTVVPLATPVAFAVRSKLAAVSETISVALDARAKFGSAASVVAWAAVTVLEVPLSWTVVPFATPPAFAASTKFAEVSATTNVAPEASEKFGLAASVAAWAAVTELDVPVT